MDTITSLYKKLEPLVRRTIRDMLGEGVKSGNESGLTWIQGTAIPEEDKSGNRGTDAIDLSLQRTDGTEVAQGNRSFMMGGYSKVLSGDCYLFGVSSVVDAGGDSTMVVGSEHAISDADSCLIAGYGVKSQDADYEGRFALAYLYAYNAGDSQFSIFHNYISVTTWAVAYGSYLWYAIPTDAVWFFDIKLVGAEDGVNDIFVAQITGVIENDGGTTTLKTSTVTYHHRDVATYETQVIANDTLDQLEIQLRDTAGPTGDDMLITVRMDTTEVIGVLS